jgi:hypothetical protein
MAMDEDAKKKIQIVLALAILIAAVRTAYILYERHEDAVQQNKTAEAPPLNPDYYVTPKKLYPYDLKSAKQLTQQPVWAKVGYRYPYFNYNPTTHHSDFAKEVGLLLPLQKLAIQDVVIDKAPDSGNSRQVFAVFEQEGKPYTVQIGTVEDNDYKFFSDAMFFVEDPRDLYKHWPADIWDSITRHEMKTGMNELQADFAIGLGIPEKQADEAWKTVHYPNGGNPLTVTYHNGKATEVKPDKVS